MLETVRLHTLMTDYTIKCGIGQKSWGRLLYNYEKWKDWRKDYVTNFILSFYDKEWKELDKARKQMCATDEMWENMELFFDDQAFPEQAVVKRAMRAMKDRWIRFKEDYRSFLNQMKIDNES